MNFRPGGWSDDEDDDDDYFGVPAREEPPTNGFPKSIEEAIIKKNNEYVLKFLNVALTKGHSLDECLPCGISSLSLSCREGYVDAVEILLKNGANPNAEKDKVTPLMFCSTSGFLNDEDRAHCADLLLSYGADPNAFDQYGQTSLMLAAMNGLPSVVEKLIKCPSINLNASDIRGWSALFFAMNAGNVDIADMLIKAGADPEILDGSGLKAGDYLQLEEDQPSVEVAELFTDFKICDYLPSSLLKDKPIVKSLDAFLSHLPNENGEGGFVQSVGDMLDSMGLSNLKLNMDLITFLSGDEEELEKQGVKLLPVRRKIVRGLHRFHLGPWLSTSIYSPSTETPLEMDSVIIAVSSVLKHLVIIQGSLAYYRNLILKTSEESFNLEERREQVKILAQLHKILRHLRQNLRFLDHVPNMVKDIGNKRPDLVCPSPQTTSKFMSWKSITVASVICAVTFLHYQCK